MSVGLYSHTTRGTGTVLTAAIYNSDHQNHITNQNPSMTGAYSDNVAQMQLATDPGGLGSEDLAASLAGELERIRFAIQRITGEAQWYIEPAINLTETEAAIIAGTFEKLIVTNEITPAEITSDQDNYAPTGHADTFVFRISSDDEWTITGLAGGVPGRLVMLHNIGAEFIRLSDEGLSSTDINRFSLGVEYILGNDQILLLRYDGTQNRWIGIHTTVFAELYAEIVKVLGYIDFFAEGPPSDPDPGIGRLYGQVDGDFELAWRDSDGFVSILRSCNTDDMQEASNRLVTAEVQHFHPAHPKAVGVINGSTGAVESGGYGFASGTTTGTGVYEITLSAALNDIKVFGLPFAATAIHITYEEVSTTVVRVRTFNNSHAAVNAGFSVQVFGTPA